MNLYKNIADFSVRTVKNIWILCGKWYNYVREKRRDTYEKRTFSDNIAVALARIFRRSGCFDGERDTGFPQRGRTLQSKIRLSARADAQPYFFERKTEDFYRFYRDKILSYAVSAKPNAAHKKLAELEEKGILSAVVTQNIDGLHQAAGSKNVFELHGSVLRNYCTRCGKSYGVDYMIKSEGVPHCSCGGIIKPDVVLYEEALDDRTVRGAVNAIASADTLIIAGTSMVVYPAAGLVNYFDGKHLVVINMSPTSADSRADLLICGKVGEVLGGVEI